MTKLVDLLKNISGTVLANGKEYFDLDESSLEAFAKELLAANSSEPIGYMTEPSLNNLINGNDVILGKENSDRSRGEMHRKIAVYLALPVNQELVDTAKDLIVSLNLIIRHANIIDDMYIVNTCHEALDSISPNVNKLIGE